MAVDLLSKVFENDPVVVFLLCSLSEEQRLAYMRSYFRSLFRCAGLNKATFEEVNDWSCASIWMPPGYKVDNPRTYIQAGGLKILWTIGLQGCKVSTDTKGRLSGADASKRMLLDFQSQSNAAKKTGLKGRTKFYYLFFIGTAFDARKQGLASALIKRLQDVAQRDQVPVWLEATTAESMRLYLKLGFSTVEEIVLGKGKVGADGRKKAEGEGVKVWAMIWAPKLQ